MVHLEEEGARHRIIGKHKVYVKLIFEAFPVIQPYKEF